MITIEENERLTRVGPGTPMGDLLRRYWLPAFVSDELSEPDCPPIRVRLLGEDLVAFRDSDGRFGLLAENCAHRRASLFYGRNEECGLRCIYHGWKYDVDGNIVDTPAEPANSMLKHHVKQKAYPCREVNGLVMTYMGPKERTPLLPDLPWFNVPADHVKFSRWAVNDCNWLQTLEGNIDSTHSAFLHARKRENIDRPYPGGERSFRNQENPPNFEVEDRRWGVVAAAHYPAGDGKDFVRTNTFVTPVYSVLPNGQFIDGRLDGLQVNVEVPMDDFTTNRISIHMQRSKPLDAFSRFSYAEVGPDYRKLFNRSNDYGIDREKQRSGLVFSGIDASFAVQDGCVVESMGVITDRTQEHLGVGDSQIAQVRQFLLRALRDLEAGQDAPGVAFSPDANDFSDLVVISSTIPIDRYWREVVSEVATYAVAAR